jgi:hypothetical protein
MAYAFRATTDGYDVCSGGQLISGGAERAPVPLRCYSGRCAALAACLFAVCGLRGVAPPPRPSELLFHVPALSTRVTLPQARRGPVHVHMDTFITSDSEFPTQDPVRLGTSAS